MGLLGLTSQRSSARRCLRNPKSGPRQVRGLGVVTASSEAFASGAGGYLWYHADAVPCSTAVLWRREYSLHTWAGEMEFVIRRWSPRGAEDDGRDGFKWHAIREWRGLMDRLQRSPSRVASEGRTPQTSPSPELLTVFRAEPFVRDVCSGSRDYSPV